MRIKVDDHPEDNRYEATVTDDGGGEHPVAGFADYSIQGRLVVLRHTEVDAAYEGRGVGSALARAALDDVRRKGLRAVPVCPFIRSWIERHPDYADVVASTR